MTSISLFPRMTAAGGVDFTAMLERLIEGAVAEHRSGDASMFITPKPSMRPVRRRHFEVPSPSTLDANTAAQAGGPPPEDVDSDAARR